MKNLLEKLILEYLYKGQWMGVDYRLDAIACDAELQEKSESDLQRLAEILIRNCEQAIEEAKNKTEQDNNEGKACCHLLSHIYVYITVSSYYN